MIGHYGSPDAQLVPLALDPELQHMRMIDPFTPGAVLLEQRQAQIEAERARQAAAARQEARGERRADRAGLVLIFLGALAVGALFGKRR